MVWTTADISDQEGKVAIVTGSNTGIGFETAKALADQGGAVILACRNIKKGEKALERIKGNPRAKVELMHLDLSSLKSIKSFADEFQSRFERLDLLINNAGVMMPPYSKTEDGFELQFGTNHIGHFALTCHLMKTLNQAGNTRIVNVSSNAHKRGNIDFNDLNWEKRKYSKIQAYCDSKIANLYFTLELDRRLKKNHNSIVCTAAHPGWTATDLQRHNRLFTILNNFLGQAAPMGALPTLMAAVDESCVGGEYFGPNGFMGMWGHPKKSKTNDLSQDKDIARRLWEVSEELTGVTYGF